MADICFRTDAFAIDPEGDLEHCNGMPGSQLTGWHVGVDYDFPPWALPRWLRRRHGRDLVRQILTVVRELIVSYPGVIVQEQRAAQSGRGADT